MTTHKGKKMGLFDLFNSEYRANKKIYNHINQLPAHNEKYKKAFTSLNAFAMSQLMLPQMSDHQLFRNQTKIKKMIAFFGGASDYVSQIMGLSDDEAIPFITFFLVLTIYDGNYKKMGEVMDVFLRMPHDSKYSELMTAGATAYQDMFKENADSTEISLRLKKILG
jgi:hypothetical protein